MLAPLTYLAFLGAFALGALWSPPSALAAVICMFGLEQWGQASHAPWASNRIFTNVAVGVMVLGALATKIMRGGLRIGDLPVNYWIVLVLFAYAFVSVAWTPGLDTALANWRQAYPYVITVIFLTPLLCAQARDFAVALRWLIILGGALSIAVLFFGQWGYRGLIVDSAYFEEANPLAIASMAGQVLVTVVLVPLVRAKTLRWLVVLVLAPMCIAVVARSGSRGQLVAALVALAISWPIARGGALTMRVLLAPAVAALIGLIGFVSIDYFGGDSARWQDADLASQDVSGRLAMAETLVRAASDDVGTLLFGLGNSASYHMFGIYPHVVALEVLAEEGLIGLGLFIAALLACALSLVRSVGLRYADPDVRAAVAALIGGTVFHLLVSFKQGSMLLNPLLFLHLILAPQLLAQIARAPAPQPSAPPAAQLTFANLMKS